MRCYISEKANSSLRSLLEEHETTMALTRRHGPFRLWDRAVFQPLRFLVILWGLHDSGSNAAVRHLFAVSVMLLLVLL